MECGGPRRRFHIRAQPAETVRPGSAGREYKSGGQAAALHNAPRPSSAGRAYHLHHASHNDRSVSRRGIRVGRGLSARGARKAHQSQGLENAGHHQRNRCREPGTDLDDRRRNSNRVIGDGRCDSRAVACSGSSAAAARHTRRRGHSGHSARRCRAAAVRPLDHGSKHRAFQLREHYRSPEHGSHDRPVNWSAPHRPTRHRPEHPALELSPEHCAAEHQTTAVTLRAAPPISCPCAVPPAPWRSQRTAVSSFRRSPRRRSTSSASASVTTSASALSASCGACRVFASSARSAGGATNVVTITISATEL